MRRPDAGSELGYTLVGLMVVVAVINVSLAVAVTSTRTLARRAREAELIWRGQQIARAVGCYEQANAGEPLTRLEQLVSSPGISRPDGARWTVAHSSPTRCCRWDGCRAPRGRGGYRERRGRGRERRRIGQSGIYRGSDELRCGGCAEPRHHWSDVRATTSDCWFRCGHFAASRAAYEGADRRWGGRERYRRRGLALR